MTRVATLLEVLTGSTWWYFVILSGTWWYLVVLAGYEHCRHSRYGGAFQHFSTNSGGSPALSQQELE